MENKRLSVVEITKAKLDLLTSRKNDLAAKLQESTNQSQERSRNSSKRIKTSLEKIAAVESLIEASRREGLEPSQQQVDALASRKNEHISLEKELASDAGILSSEALRGEIIAEIKEQELALSEMAKQLELATQLESEWHGDTHTTLLKGSDTYTQDVSGIPKLLILPSLKEALKLYFSEMPIKVQSDENNIVTSIEMKPYPGKCDSIIVPLKAGQKRRILVPYLINEWIDQAHALAKGESKQLEIYGNAPYGYADNKTSHSRGSPFEAFHRTKAEGGLLFKEHSGRHGDADYASHPNRACFFYAEDTETAYALKPHIIDRCELIRKETRAMSYAGVDNYTFHREVTFLKRTPSDCTALFRDFTKAIDEILSTVKDGINSDKLPDNALGLAIADLLTNTTTTKTPLTHTDLRPDSEEAFKLIAPYWEAVIQAPWGPEIIGTYADIKDLCLSGAKPHAWLDNAKECIGLRFLSKSNAWLVAHLYCPAAYQNKADKAGITVRSLRQGSNYKEKTTPGQVSHLVQSGPCLIRILSHPDR